MAFSAYQSSTESNKKALFQIWKLFTYKNPSFDALMKRIQPVVLGRSRFDFQEKKQTPSHFQPILFRKVSDEKIISQDILSD